jgi:uncharacterized membrane protein YfcA
MGPTKISGLPAHILLVHLAIVAVPFAAVLTVMSTVWPAARRRLGIVTPLAALGALIVVPITTHAGEWLQDRVTPSKLIARHVHLGHELLPWAIGLFLVALAQWLWFRTPGFGARPAGDPAVETGTAPRIRLAVGAVAAVLAVAVGVGSVVQIYRIGESGSKAVWTGSFSETPRTPGS